MLLHLLSESKFARPIMAQFDECLPGENLYLLFPGETSLNKEDQNTGSVLFIKDNPEIDFSTIKGVIVHYLSISKSKFLSNVPKDIPVACSLWGGDFYNFLPEFKNQIYSNLTKDFLRKFKKAPRLFYILKNRIYFPFSEASKSWNKAARRSGLFSTVVPYERDLVNRFFPDAQFMHLPTYSLDKVVTVENFESTVPFKSDNNQKNVLIGNSGNPTNNHSEILHYIALFKDSTVRVNVPLTYGDTRYIPHICRMGESLLGKQFQPLLKHLDHKSYYDYVESNNVCIFNNYRQQGLGTINLCLWGGGKVYLSTRNLTLRYLKDMGLKVFSVEDDLLPADSEDIFEPLSRDEICTNRKALLNLYSKESVNNYITKFTRRLKSANSQ